ncbi:MAG: DUF5990 family protein [Pseudomonadota bacterium]
MSVGQISVKLICRDFPKGEGLHLGIQEGKEVTDLRPLEGKEIIFEAPFRLGARKKDGGPNFLGAYAQGTPGERFLYLNWGQLQGDGSFDYPSRAKVHLSHISWQDIEKADKAGKPLTAELTMTDQRGNPICATVRPENISWKL